MAAIPGRIQQAYLRAMAMMALSQVALITRSVAVRALVAILVVLFNLSLIWLA